MSEISPSGLWVLELVIFVTEMVGVLKNGYFMRVAIGLPMILYEYPP